jgi:hypothetical protein
MSQKSITYCKEVTIILSFGYQLIEKPLDFTDTILVELRCFLAERLKEILEKEYQTQKFS